MRPIIALLIVALVALLSYFLWPVDEPPAPAAPIAALDAASGEQVVEAASEQSDTAAVSESDSQIESEAQAEFEAQVESEAQTYIAKLTEPDVQPVEVEKADHFITQDQVISLIPSTAVESLTLAQLTADPAITAATPITLVKEVEQIEITTPERIIAESGGDIEAIVRIIDEENIKIQTVREVLAEYAHNPNKIITVVRIVKYFEITTPGELAADSALSPNTMLNIIKQPYRLEAATITELLRQEMEISPDSIFYVRTVRETDEHGIWGIVQEGILGNFAQGMAIRRGEEVNTYQVVIPEDADEMLTDRSSSYLGRLIHAKTQQSHVYNFKDHRMGKNPDRIYPGQEIVIINFLPDELINVYRHFVDQ